MMQRSKSLVSLFFGSPYPYLTHRLLCVEPSGGDRLFSNQKGNWAVNWAMPTELLHLVEAVRPR
jgi:hypothetical protein